jgi:uncharacterized membrane protein
MNRFIARIFSWMLSSLHILIIISLVTIIYKYHHNKNTFVALFGNNADNDSLVYSVVFALFLLYVMIMGLLSTFVAMNDNLEEIKEKLNITQNS